MVGLGQEGGLALAIISYLKFFKAFHQGFKFPALSQRLI